MHDTAVRRIATLTAIALLAAGCSERTLIKTEPAGAIVLVNGQYLGTSPVEFAAPTHSVSPGLYHYRVEKDGYVPKEGDIATHVDVGHIIVSILFTAGISMIFRGARTFPDETLIEMRSMTAAGQAPDGRNTAQKDPAQKLRQVQDLYDQGLINEQEYRRYRSDILHGIVNETDPAVP